MSNVPLEAISRGKLLDKLNQQYRLLHPADTAENAILADAFVAVRDRISELLQRNDAIGTEVELTDVCKKLDQEFRSFLTGKSSDERIQALDRDALRELRTTITSARQHVRKQLEREMGWGGQANPADAALEALTAAINRWEGLNLQITTREKTPDEKFAQLPEKTRKAFHAMANYFVDDLGIDPALLAQVLCLIDAEHFSWNPDTINSIAGLVGKHKSTVEPGFPNIPPEILVSPKAGYFRKIAFNQLREKFFPLFNQSDGLRKVRRAIADEIETVNAAEKGCLAEAQSTQEKEDVRYEFALKRRFLSALSQYFEVLESQPHPSRLKNSLSGDEPFPNRYQQVAMYETALLGRFFNAGEMGSGKTGAAIGSFEHLSEQMDDKGEALAKRALILCPANIVNVWRQRLSDNDGGYFRKGTLKEGDVVIIDGPPDKRRAQFEKSRKARYVVIGIEMSRSETETINHEEWIQSLGADFLIIDEVHNVKNPEKKENSDTDRIYRISQGENMRYKVLLSGTPIPNHRKDIAAQLRLLHADPAESEGRRQHRLAAFERLLKEAPVSTADARILAKHADEEESMEHEAITGINWHNLAHLTKVVEDCDVPITQHYLLPYLYRPRAADSLPVHAKLNPVIEDHYGLTAQERMAYARVLEAEKLSDLFHELPPDIEDRELGLLQKVHYLHRICLHEGALNGTADTGESKFARLTHWIDQFAAEDSHSGKIAITSPHYAAGVTRGGNWTEGEVEFDTIHEKLAATYEAQGIPVFIVDGRAQTKQNLRRFREHKGPAVLLTQMKVVREGIDLSYVSRMIMLSSAWTRAEEDQFWRRFYRRGQEHDVQGVKLVAKDTIEEGINILSEQKEVIGERLLNGRHLTEDELQLLEVGNAGGSANPYLWWTMLPPKEKLNVLWGQMMHRGERFVRETMRRLGPLFAELYNHDWETSYNGNTARLVAGIIDQLQENYLPKLREGQQLEIADIASGAFAVARTLTDKKNTRVSSSDINHSMIGPEIGTRVLGGAYDQSQTDVAAMDDLPYRKNSKHIAVLSLALHYAMHRDNPEEAGKERIRTVMELNRVVTQDGAAIITFPPGIFRGRKRQKFDELIRALRYFGFDLIPELSERASAKGQCEEKPFEVFVFTLRKVGEPAFDLSDKWEDIPEAVRKGLDLSKKKCGAGGSGEQKKKKKKKKVEHEPGAFHDTFTLGSGIDIRFFGAARQRAIKERVKEKQSLLAGSPDVVRVALEQYQTLEDVPPETWLEISLDAIVQSPPKVQDAYAQALLTRDARTITQDFLAGINDGQELGSLSLRRTKGRQYLVLSSITESDRQKQRKYLVNGTDQ